MYISKESYPRKILTSNGIKDIDEIVAGDYLIEWRTNNHLEVKAISMVPYKNMYKITYSDGRIEYHTNIEPLYLNEYTVAPHHPFCKCRTTKDFPIKLYPVEFNKGIHKPLFPDPYVAAALLIYGDQSEEYLNYPLDRVEANNQFSHMYNVDYFPLVGNNKVYFQWKGKTTDHRITWEEFFDGYKFYAVDKSYSIVPNEYLYSSFKDRIQSIRGIFDMGYIDTRSPDSVSMFHWDESTIKIVQSILHSLAIPSTIFKDESEKSNRKWSLQIEGFRKYYPGFFYWRPYIDKMIRTDETVTKLDYPYQVTVVDVEALENCECFFHNPAPHIILERPHMIYVSTNFLPRVSI